MSVGKVYLVGAGPGDTELITTKGLRLIKAADAICYDHLISKELLTFAKPGAQLISVGKHAANHTMDQKDINALLIELAKQGKTVVRLKGGDCYLFGRGGEEVEECHDKSIPFEVVPGITSALSAPCYAGIPATHRDFTSNLAIVTGHRKKGDTRPIDIPKADTVILLMSVGNIKNIVPQMLSQGWDKTTPIAAIEHGTFYDQRTITATLETFLDKVSNTKLRTPAIFVIGKVVTLSEKLDFFTKRPNTLVLGNHPERYAHLGNIVHRRMIDCVPIDDYTQADNTLQNIKDYHWIVFTSPNAAKYMFPRLAKMDLDTRALTNAKIAAIGKTTAARLKEFGLIPDMVPQTESSKGLLEEFKNLNITGQNILLPQALVASETLPKGLQSLGANVTKTTVYKTTEIDPQNIDFDYIDQILFTSGSTVKAFIKKYSAVPDHIKTLCLGKPTLEIAKQHNINAQIIPTANKDKK